MPQSYFHRDRCGDVRLGGSAPPLSSTRFRCRRSSLKAPTCLDSRRSQKMRVDSEIFSGPSEATGLRSTCAASRLLARELWRDKCRWEGRSMHAVLADWGDLRTWKSYAQAKSK